MEGNARVGNALWGERPLRPVARTPPRRPADPTGLSTRFFFRHDERCRHPRTSAGSPPLRRPPAPARTIQLTAIPPAPNPRRNSVSETATWDEFCALICARLQLSRVRAVFHASTMSPLTSMDELQDIEDLVVEGDEIAGARVGAAPGGASAGIGGRTGGSAPGPALTMDEDGEDKYRKKAPLHVQLMQQIAPGLTAKIGTRADTLDAMESGRKAGGHGRHEEGRTPTKGAGRRRGAIGGGHRRTDPRTVIVGLSLLSCIATMILLYSRLARTLP